ncbi:MAG: hypothetical protein WC728_14550 [Elusimicrobiota bacterium]
MRKDSGVALVQVLVMSVLLIILAAGVLQIIFGTHGLIARTQAGDKAKYYVEACMAQKSAIWAGNPCNGAASDTCSFTTPSGLPLEVRITCGANNRVSYCTAWGDSSTCP